MRVVGAESIVKRCCVILPYFEEGDGLVKSLESLRLDGDLEHADVLVVDDGSTATRAADVLAAYPRRPPNLRLLELPVNRGLEHALNAGLLAVKDDYQYIARLDCGDVCVNDRLATQIAYLQEHPNTMLLGSWIEFVDPDGSYLYTFRQPIDWAGIRRRMFVMSSVTHPSVVLRSCVLDVVGLYPTDRPASEDFAFFVRIVERYETANLPLVLVRCVIDPAGISSRRRRQQILSRRAVLLDHFEPRPRAVYGIVRATIQLATSRRVTILINQIRERLRL